MLDLYKVEINEVNYLVERLLYLIAREMNVDCQLRWQSKNNPYIIYDHIPIDESLFNFKIILVGEKKDVEFVEYLYYKYAKILTSLEKNLALELEDRKEIKAHKRPRKTVLVKKESRTANGK